MKLLFAFLMAILLGAIILTGCGKEDNPVEPEEKLAIEVRAQELYNQDNNIIDAAGILKTEYNVGADSILSALYKAGYTPEDITSAVRIVFDKTPANAEPLLVNVLKDFELSKIAELILKEYKEYLTAHREELLQYAHKMNDNLSMVGILKNHYSFTASDIYIVLYNDNRKPVDIISALKIFFEMSNEEYINLMIQNNAGINEIIVVIKTVFNYEDEDAAELLINLKFEIPKIVGAIKAAYNTSAVRMAVMIAPHSSSVKEFLFILLNNDYTLIETGYVIKNYYLMDAKGAAATLKEMNIDAKNISRVLREVYGLSEIEILIILKESGFLLQDLVGVLLDIFNLSTDEIIQILVQLGYDHCEILNLLGIPC